MRNYLCLGLALLVLFPQVWCQAQQLSAEQEARIQKLENIIREQDQKIQALQNKVSDVQQPSREYTEQIVREYMSRPDAEEVPVSAGYEGRGFFVRSGDLELFMSGYVQAGLAVFENSSYENNSFYLNDISLAFDVYFMKSWHARVQFNLGAHSRAPFTHPLYGVTYGSSPFNSSGVIPFTLRDAYVEYIGMPEFNFRIGNTHVPFTMQGQYGANEGMDIWGASFINAWSHGRDHGMMLYGTLSDTFEYKMGIFNGEGANINHSDDFLMAGSIRLYPFKKSENPYTFFHVGVIRTRDNAESHSGAALFTPWGRQVFDGVVGGSGSDTQQGWTTGVDTAFRLDMHLDPEKVNRIWSEIEFMYQTWERALTTGRLPWLQGYGVSFGLRFQHNLTPDVEGAGIFPVFRFAYSDIDNKSTDDFTGAPGDTYGQRAFVYTFGLGYSFNKYVTAQWNWVMVNLDEKELYGGPKAKADVSDSLEQAWFFQVTAQW